MSNQTQGKTHYRKVFKSDHLGQADLEDFKEAGSNLVFTISHVNQLWGTKVAGKTIDANMAYFVEDIKPWVVNATNCAVLKKLTGSPFITDWKNVPVQLYIDPKVKLKGEVTGGVKISPLRPKLTKPQITKESAQMWKNAKQSFIDNGNFINVFKRADITPGNQALMLAEIKDEAVNV